MAVTRAREKERKGREQWLLNIKSQKEGDVGKLLGVKRPWW